jgi:hypothetical protein
MRGGIPSLPQYAFMEWCLVKHRDTGNACGTRANFSYVTDRGICFLEAKNGRHVKLTHLFLESGNARNLVPVLALHFKCNTACE